MTPKTYATIDNITLPDSDGPTYQCTRVMWTDDNEKPFKYTRTFKSYAAAVDFVKTLPRPCFVIYANNNAETLK